MRTEEPLQGFILGGGHYLIHFVLLISEPICWHLFSGNHCDSIATPKRNLVENEFFSDYFRELEGDENATETADGNEQADYETNKIDEFDTDARYNALAVHLYCFLS
jgi:hypothetical protein